MYSKYENPVFKATLFYYDNTYNINVSMKVLSILKQHNMFPPEKIYADSLTRNRYIKSNENTENIFIKSYNEKDVMGVDMASGRGQIGSEFWRFTWNYTFYKNSNVDLSKVKFKPWNTVSLSSTYGRLKDADIYMHYMACVKDLIAETKPFFACIDDVDNKVKKYRTQGLRFDDKVLPDEIYWGNYWCDHYIENTNPNAFEYLCKSGAICERIAGGVLFCMTDSAFDFGSKKVIDIERRFSEMLG